MALLALLVLVAYGNSLPNDFVLDDVSSISENPHINEAGSFWTPPFFSLSSFIIYVVHKFFGPNPAAYRWINIIFHLFSTWTAYALLTLIFCQPVPIFAAAIFAVHPILTEVITWISGGPYIQYNLFLLISLGFYILSEKQGRLYIFSLLSFIVALLFTERAFTFPLVLICWELARGGFKQNWKKIIPFLLLAGIRVLPSLLTIGARMEDLTSEFGLKAKVENPLLHLPIAFSVYLQLVLFPKGLCFYHSKSAYTYAEYGVRLAVFLSYLILIGYFYFRRRRQAFFWTVFFTIPLLPVLTPLRVACHIAERYVSGGVLGIFVLTAMVFQKLSEPKRLGVNAYFIFSALIIILTMRTIARNRDWKDEHALWLATIAVSPNSVNAHNNLCASYVRRGEWENALREALITIKLLPNYAHPYHNIGGIYLVLGRNKEAKAFFEKAVSLNPNLWQAYRGLGEIYYDEGNLAMSLENFLKAAQLKPDDADVQTNLGIIYLRRNDVVKAQQSLQRALEINPRQEKARQMLGLIGRELQEGLLIIKAAAKGRNKP